MAANFALYFKELERCASARALPALQTLEMGRKTGQKAGGIGEALELRKMRKTYQIASCEALRH
jgi:hypothetical protein